MSRRNLIGSGQNSANPLLDDRWIAARSAITRGSWVFSACEHCVCVSRNASARKLNLCPWPTPRDDFSFLDGNIYFHKGCNYLNDANEICNDIFNKSVPLINCKNSTILTKNEDKRWYFFLFCPPSMVW